MFRLGYNTNGLAHHRLLDALRLLSEIGYEGVALTPDVGHLDPYQASAREVEDARYWADELGLSVVLETGARFVMDARRKHFPTLLEEEPAARARRVDFLRRCVLLAQSLGADVVSLWSGAAPDGRVADWPAEAKGADGHLWERLLEGLGELLPFARRQGVRLAFEPEPGMFIATPRGYEMLLERLGGLGGELGLCLDVGHCLCTGDLPVAEVIRTHAERLWQVHLDDIRGGVHEHRPFGEGDLDLAGVLNALIDVGYDGMAAVELSRDSHRAPEVAREAMARLREALGAGG